MNYIFQREDFHPYQCGAFALYNLLFSESEIDTKINLEYLIDKCNACQYDGTTLKNFNKAILDIKFKFHIEIEQYSDFSIKTIKEILSNNQPIIILFHWYQDAHEDNHYALIDKMYKQNSIYTFRVINYSFDKPIHIISERVLKSMLLPYTNEYGNMPVIWSKKC